MSFDQFLKASNKFSQGLQQYVQTEALGQANNKLAEIQEMQNTGLIKQEEAIQQASQLSQLLSNQLAGAGADAATIANTAGRFGVSASAMFQANENKERQQASFSQQEKMADIGLQNNITAQLHQEKVDQRNRPKPLDFSQVSGKTDMNALPSEERSRFISRYGLFKDKEQAKIATEKIITAESGFKGIDKLINIGNDAKVPLSKKRAEAQALATLMQGQMKDIVVGSGAVTDNEWDRLGKVITNPADLTRVQWESALRTVKGHLAESMKIDLTTRGLSERDFAISPLGKALNKSKYTGKFLKTAEKFYNSKHADPEAQQLARGLIEDPILPNGKKIKLDESSMNYLYEKGFPVEAIIEESEQRGLSTDWLQETRDARKAQVLQEKIRKKKAKEEARKNAPKPWWRESKPTSQIIADAYDNSVVQKIIDTGIAKQKKNASSFKETVIDPVQQAISNQRRK